MQYSFLYFLLLTGSILFRPAKSCAQRLQDSTLDKKIGQLVTQKLSAIAPGCVVLVAKGRQIIYEKAFGLADLATQTPMQTGMIFRIGSMSKQYTAVAALQLVEQGRLSLMDTIQRFVPGFAAKAYPVTIQNLLSQTSGIIDFQAIAKPDPAKVHANYTPQQGVDYFKDEPLQFKPGSQFAYSNSNFYLLGYIIEQITGLTYEDYIKKYLFEPAGLAHTYYVREWKSVPFMASGYSRFNGKDWEQAELQNPTIMYATGGILANAEDLLKWHLALADGKLLKSETLQQAYTPRRLANDSLSDYGYGWFVKSIDGEKTVEHSGSTDGYQTNEIYLPRQDIFVALLFNGFEQAMDWQIVSNDVTRLAMGHPLRPELKLPDDSLKRYAGIYTFNKEHQLAITLKNHQLYVVATNPKDKLPRLPLFAADSATFYIKEAPLKIVFVWDEAAQLFKLVTYNQHGKDAEWKKTK